MTEATPDWAVRIPNAGIHPDRRAGLPPPFDALQLAEIGQNFIEGFLKQVVLAVAGVFLPNMSSFQQLQNWADNNGLGALLSLLGLNYVGDLADLIGTAVVDANGAAGDWISLLDTVGVVSAHDAGAIINAAYTDATQIAGDITTLLTRVGQATMLGLGDVILDLRADVNTVAGDTTTLLNAAGVASTEILGALIAAIDSDTQGVTAAIGALLSDLGVPNIHGVTGIIGSANTNANTAVGNFNSVLSGLGLPDADSLATFISNTNTLAANMSTNFVLLATELDIAAGIPALGSYLTTTNANALSAVNDFTTLLGDLAVGDIGALATYIDNANTAAATSLNNWTTIFADAAVADAAGLASLITNINAAPAELIQSGVNLLTTLVQWFLGELGLSGDVLTLAAWLNEAEANAAKAVNVLVGLFGNLENVIVDGVVDVDRAIISLLNTIVAAAASAPALLAAMKDFVAAALSLSVEDVAGLGGYIAGQITTALGKIPRTLITDGELATTAITDLGTYMGGQITTALGQIPETLITDGTLLGEAVTGQLNSAVTILSGDATTLDAFFSSLVSDFGSANLAAAGSVLRDVNTDVGHLTSAVAIAGTSMENLIGAMVSMFSGAISSVGNILSALGYFIAQIPGGGGIGGELVGWGGSLITDANVLTSEFDSAANSINATLASIGSNLPTSMNAAGLSIAAAGTIAESSSAAIVDQLINNPSWLGALNALATFPITSVPQSGSPPVPSTIPVTKTTSAIGEIGPVTNYGVGSQFESICYMGSITGTLTSIVFNIYSVDKGSGVNTLAWTSGNQITSPGVSSGMSKNFCNIDPSAYITEAKGEWFNVEMQVLGTGTYNLVGITHWTTGSSVPPTDIGSSRTDGTAVPVAPASMAAPTVSANVPWLALATTPGVSESAPELWSRTAAGSYTYTKPEWANYFDVVVLGGGGGGVNGAFLTGGFGGSGGTWSALRVTKADAAGASTFAVVVGGGGGPGPAGGAAGSGAASSVTITGLGGPISGAGGAGGVGNVNGAVGHPGAGPGDEVFNDFYGGVNTYSGGASQGGAQGNGNSPGGGAAGGNGVIIGTYIGGGTGAPGAVFILAYQ